jgi:hypothetical protein
MEATPPVAGRSTLVPWLVVGLSLAAFWATAHAADWFIDRPFLMPPPDAPSAVASSRTLTPVENGLTLAALTFVLPAIAAAAFALRGRERPFVAIADFVRGDPRVVPALAATVAIAGAAFVGFALVGHTELLDDERSYLFQADLLRHGKFAEAGLPHAFRNQMVLVDPVHTSKYPPGNALLLALGMLVHAPGVVHPILAGVLVVALHAFVKDAFGEREAHLAAALAALSPFVWAIDGTVLAFGTAGTCVALLLAGVARHDRTGSTPSALVAGAALGFLALTRPFDAAAIGAPIALWCLLRSRSRVRTAALVGAGVLAFAWLIPVQNHAVTGSWTSMPYGLDHENPMKLGFTRPFAGPYVHSVGGGLFSTATLFARLDGWLVGIPGALLLAIAGMAQRDPGAKLLRWVTAIFAVAFLVIPGPGTWDVGPTYGFVIAPLLFAAMAHGAAALARFGASHRSAIEWGLLGAVAAAFVTVTPLRFARLTELASAIRSPWEAVASSGIGEANVVVPTIRGRMAAGWGYGYPPEIETSATTKAHLFFPLSRAEYDEALPLLPKVPVYVLVLDGPGFARTGERKFVLAPADPEQLFPKKPAPKPE